MYVCGLNVCSVCVSNKLATVVEDDQKVPFSIATTPRCRGWGYSFPWIAPLYPWYVPYIAECQARRYQGPFLKYLVWHDLGLNPGLPDHWRTLYPLDQWAALCVHIYMFTCARVCVCASVCLKESTHTYTHIHKWTMKLYRCGKEWVCQYVCVLFITWLYFDISLDKKYCTVIRWLISMSSSIHDEKTFFPLFSNIIFFPCHVFKSRVNTDYT